MALTIGQPGSSRVVVVAGLRTPFVKAAGVFSGLTSLDLGAIVVREMIERSGIDPAVIDQVVFGQAIPTLLAPSIAREVGIASALPKALEAHTVSRACATSLQAFTDVASAMALGVSQVAVAGVPAWFCVMSSYLRPSAPPWALSRSTANVAPSFT